MNCIKCGYAIPKGQDHCTYCGTIASRDTVQKSEQPAVKRTSAFAKQLKNAPSEVKAESVSAAEKPADQKPSVQQSKMPFAQKTAERISPKQPESAPSEEKSAGSPYAQFFAGAASANQPVIAPYARRPMYSSFDPNSEDSPFVRQTQIQKSEEQQLPDQQSECRPESPAVDQMSEDSSGAQPVQDESQQPDDNSREDNTESAAVSKGAPKKPHGLSTAALTLVFAALIFCWFIIF